jgi:hypothetical protein
MSNDISLAKSDQPIKHGTLIIATSAVTNSFQYQNNNVYNKPFIADIENKYDDRFDDVTYYTIGHSYTVVP